MNVGIALDDPYEPAVTAVLFKDIAVVPAVSSYVAVIGDVPTTEEPIMS